MTILSVASWHAKEQACHEVTSGGGMDTLDDVDRGSGDAALPGTGRRSGRVPGTPEAWSPDGTHACSAIPRPNWPPDRLSRGCFAATGRSDGSVTKMFLKISRPRGAGANSDYSPGISSCGQ